MELSEVAKIPPYSLSKREKESIHVDLLSDLIRHHYHCCGPYKRYLDAIKFDPQKPHDRQDLPFLPINIFKSEHLLSVASNQTLACPSAPLGCKFERFITSQKAE